MSLIHINIERTGMIERKDRIRLERKEWVSNDIAMNCHCVSNVQSLLTNTIAKKGILDNG